MWGDKDHQFEPLPICMTASARQIVLLLMSRSKREPKIEREREIHAGHKHFFANFTKKKKISLRTKYWRKTPLATEVTLFKIKYVFFKKSNSTTAFWHILCVDRRSLILLNSQQDNSKTVSDSKRFKKRRRYLSWKIAFVKFEESDLSSPNSQTMTGLLSSLSRTTYVSGSFHYLSHSTLSCGATHRLILSI